MLSTTDDSSPAGGQHRLIAVRLMIGFLFALGALALTPNLSQAAPQGPWVLPAADLSVSGEDADDSQIAVGPDGTATAVWQRYNGTNYIVQAATRPPGGSFGTPVNLSVAGEDAYYPQVAIGPDGTATVVWERYDGSNWIIQAATRPPGGSFGTPVNLSSGTDSQIAIGSDGTATVVWKHYDGTNDIIQAATRPPGGPFAEPDQLSVAGEDASQPQVAVDPDGTATAVWRRFNGTNFIIQAATRPPGGSFATPVNLSVAGESAQSPQVAAGPDGTATAVWRRYDGSNDIIQSASTEAPEFTLNVEKSGDGAGTVTSAPAGIDCGFECTEDYLSYTLVTLTANPDLGSSFTGFSGGGCVDPGTTCEVTMDQAHTVVASFAAVCPARKINKRGLNRNKRKGLAWLKVTGGGAGKVILQKSKNNRKFVKNVNASGKGALKIKARGRALRKLRIWGKVRIKVKFTYKPGSGCAGKTKTTRVTLVKRWR